MTKIPINILKKRLSNTTPTEPKFNSACEIPVPAIGTSDSPDAPVGIHSI